MDRKFLKDLGLDKELVDKILDEAGKDVESHKEEVSDLKTQLKTAQDTLKSFDGVDVGELKGKITELTNSLATKDTEYQQKMADIEFNKTVDLSIAAFGARNAKTVKALLDVDTLKDSKNQESDIRTALEAVKKENDYLFQTEKTTPRVVTSTSGINQESESKKEKANEAFRSLYGKDE